ncbi:MAG: histidine phosphatase family protein [Pseudodonghicola sp.]
MILQRRFCVIRHGETDANRAGRIAGRIEAELTEQGRAEARALSAFVWPAPVLLYVSPQLRARETAALAFPGRQSRLLDDLRERDWGRLEGRPLAEMIAREDTPPEGESWPGMLDRVGRGLAQALADPRDGLPVLVAHSGTIRAIRRLTGGTEHGERPRNAAPLLFTPAGSGWVESALLAADSEV